jgi:hypothetical protein
MPELRRNRDVPVVFISSTAEDLEAYRDAARDAAVGADCLPGMMEYFVASGDKPPLETCLGKVSDADVLVVIVAHRYGWVPPDQPGGNYRSITWLECLEAEREGKEILAFVVDEKQPWPEDKREESAIVAAIRTGNATPELLTSVQRNVAEHHKLKEWLNGRGIHGMFTTPEDLRGKVSDALRQWRIRHPRPAGRTASDRGASRKTAKVTPAKVAVPSRYLEWLQHQCSDIELLGLDVNQGQAVRLRNVYVPLTTASGAEKEQMELTRPKLLLDCVGAKTLYVSGAPGCGKSTFCRWVALVAASGAVPDHPVPPPEEYGERFPELFRDRLPLLVRLRDFWNYLPAVAGARELSRGRLEAALAAWLDDARPGSLTSREARAHLAQGSALLILDGVDEVPLTRGEAPRYAYPRSMLVSGLAAALPDWIRAGTRVLLTSRPYGLSEAEARALPLEHTLIEDLAPELQDLLVRRWFHVLEPNAEQADRTARAMLDHVRGREELLPVAANPMLLTAMCIVYHEGRRLPQDKADLYRRTVDKVLYNRYPSPEVIERVRERLSVIAYGMHTGDGLDEERTTPEATVTFPEIHRMLKAYRDESDWTERGFTSTVEAREDMLTQSGLLITTAKERAGFYHFSFQEYLAARRFLEAEEARLPAAFSERAERAEWRNTLSFAFSSLLSSGVSPARAVRFLAQLVEELGPESPLGLQVAAADAIMVLVGKGIRLRDELEERFRSICLWAIEREVPARERLVLGLALGYLGDPRIIEDLRDERAYVRIPAGEYLVGEHRKPFLLKQPFVLARYPVTNSQYALFLRGGGYENAILWSDEGRRWLEGTGTREPAYFSNARLNGPNQPVVGVSFHEAEAFCAWVGGRLPDMYEWQIAGGGPDGFEYPWGDDWQNGLANSREAGLGVTSPVGLFPRARSKSFGLEDMAGNVWEWTRSFYDQARFGAAHVMRGGSWAYPARGCRTAFPYHYELPVSRRDSVGFRPARSFAKIPSS